MRRREDSIALSEHPEHVGRKFNIAKTGGNVQDV
jgi:hypothetical protein